MGHAWGLGLGGAHAGTLISTKHTHELCVWMDSWGWAGAGVVLVGEGACRPTKRDCERLVCVWWGPIGVPYVLWHVLPGGLDHVLSVAGRYAQSAISIVCCLVCVHVLSGVARRVLWHELNLDMLCRVLLSGVCTCRRGSCGASGASA